MAWKRKVVGDRTNIAEKMSMHMALMGYDGDYHSTISQALKRRFWKRKSKLNRKWCRRLQYLLFTADSATLLSYTVGLGRLIWRDNLKAKRRKFEKKLSEKISRWSVKKRKRRGKPGKLRTRRRLNMENKGKRGNVVVPKMVTGFQMRPVWGTWFRMVVWRKVKRQQVKVESGSLMYRLAMAMKYLSLRNLCINSEWDFWAICFVQKFCGFWGSIAFDYGLRDCLVSVAEEFGLNVVSAEHLERLESCFGCSSSMRCLELGTTKIRTSKKVM